MQRGYEKTYDWVVKLLQDCDFEDSAKRLDLRAVSRNEVSVDFLGRTYLVNRQGVSLAEEKIPWSVASEGFDHNLKSVLGYYVLSEANLDPVNDYCVISGFSGGVFREGGEGDVFNNPLGKVYGADYGKFRAVAERLGMEAEESKPDLKYTWRYRMLPKIPIKIVYYEGDDEYPTKLQLLYDKTAILFYKFEPLAVLNGCFIAALAAIGETHG
ncbi:MAG: DUF3786 domain-containing protein [Treponema sp.]|jgi:hypothetical protein|nr:DUF3786 domain-containing protein [Treponema sp.]